MIKMRQLFNIFLTIMFTQMVGSATSAYSQDMADFVGLKSTGDVPADFTTLSSEKFNDDFAKNEDKSLKKEFFLKTRFYIDELLLSGRILFNEPLSDYLSAVAKRVLITEKSLFKSLRFYVLKSTAVNAFSTDQGIILFTTGLLAQLENEAQLAFIIAHEVSHYTEKHVRQGYVERQTYLKSQGRYKRLSYDDAVNTLSVYDKKTELEADKKGIDLYLKTQYATNEIFTGFDVLLYSHLPFEERIFDTTYLNTEEMIIPGSFFSDTINQISLEADFDDEGSTHPNIQTRIDEALDYIGEKDSKGDKKFIVSEDKFNQIRTMARFESINLDLASRKYSIALYKIFLLQHDYPDNRFLDLSMVKGLYGLVKYKNRSRYAEVTEKPEKIEGESFVLHAFLHDIDKAKLNVIAIRHIHDMKMKYPDDPTFDDYYLDMKKEFVMESSISLGNLRSSDYKTFIAQLDSTMIEFDVEDSIKSVDNSDLSKYEKIRLKKKLRKMLDDEETMVFEDDFHLFALHDLVTEENFVEDLRKIKKEVKIENEQKDSIRIARLKDQNRHGSHLGIKKLVVVDPLYENYGLDDDKKQVKSENKKISISDIYNDDYKKLDLETTVLESKQISASEVEKYNNLGLVKLWMSEVLDHDEIDMISSSRDRMRDVVDYYGTSKFMFSGIYSYKERSKPSKIHLYGIIFFYTAPLAIADLLVVHNYFDMISFEMDAINDKVEFVQSQKVNLKSIDSILRAYIYDILYQLSSEKE